MKFSGHADSLFKRVSTGYGFIPKIAILSETLYRVAVQILVSCLETNAWLRDFTNGFVNKIGDMERIN